MPDEELDLENLDSETSDDKTSQNDNANADNKLKSALAQKEHYKSKFEKTEAELSALRQELEALKRGSNQAPTTNATNGSDERIAIIEFSIANKDLDAEDVREIADYAKAKGITLTEAKESPLIKSYLYGKQKAKIEEQRTFANRSGFSTPEKPISKMTREEHLEYWRKANKK